MIETTKYTKLFQLSFSNGTDLDIVGRDVTWKSPLQFFIEVNVLVKEHLTEEQRIMITQKIHRFLWFLSST